MTTVVGVRFREVGKIYYFDPGELELNPGDNVIVDTVRGTEFGTVMIGNRKVEDEEIVQPLKIVRRRATNDDAERVKSNREKEKDAFNICKEKIKERGLDMKLISAEYTFDNAKILFYFTADGRVDFRELVKDLASVFKIRIELRQVGVRDETKLMGGLGGCGRPLCCASYLSDFVPVSIRMAKEQNLSLNPQKISGVCGRLMCCLKNEADTYEDLNTRLPKDGGKVITPDGREGIAESVNVLRERVRVLFTDDQGNREMEEFAASDLKFTPRRKTRPADKEAPEAAPKKKKLNSFDEQADAEMLEEIDEIVDELIEEAEEETDARFRTLEKGEIEDVFEDEVNEIKEIEAVQTVNAIEALETLEAISALAAASGNVTASGEVQEPKKHRRRHRRHNRPNQNGTEKPQQTETASSQASQEQRQKDDGGEHKPRHHRFHHRHNNPNNPNNQNNQNNQNKPEHIDNQPNGGEKKFNGAHRRFRKRRPKANTES